MNNDKELIIALDEAEREITTAVNSVMQKCGLPCFLAEPIIANIHRQLIDGKAAELAAAKARCFNQKEDPSESNE